MQPDTSPLTRLGAWMSAVALCATAACGIPSLHDLTGGDDMPPLGAPQNRVDGTLNGVPYAAASAVYATSSNAPGPSKNATVVALSNHEDLCSQLSAQTLDANSTLSLIYLSDTNPGQFSAAPSALFVGKPALAGFVTFDDNCASTLQPDDATAATGAVNVARLDEHGRADDRAQGAFRFEVGSQKSVVSGSFDANYCAGLEPVMQALLAKVSLLDDPDQRAPLTCRSARKPAAEAVK